MRSCFICKYPPIQGGISSQTYWLSKALGNKDHEVFITTNANEVEKEYRERISKTDGNFISPKSVSVFNTDQSPEANPMHIPASKTYVERLSNLAIQVIQDNEIEIIDSWYFVPYGAAGLVTKFIVKKPFIVRHAGSDLGRFLPSPAFNTLLNEILKNADKIVTYKDTKHKFLSMGISEDKLLVFPKIFVDPEAFNPKVEPFDLGKVVKRFSFDLPVITYIGKIPYYFETKGLVELLHAVKNINEDFLLFFVANGTGMFRFKKMVREMGLENKSFFMGFLPPWTIPSIIGASTCVIAAQYDFPFQSFISSIPLETMAVGKCPVISHEMHACEPYSELVDGESVLVVNPKNVLQFRKTLKEIIRNRELSKGIGLNAYRIFKQVDNFNEVVSRTIQMYEEVGV